ncbi:MAG: hypothetical protein WCV90_00895 [Candidatus Woesearchaeota archaeon]|jgi:hypothetical protein
MDKDSFMWYGVSVGVVVGGGAGDDVPSSPSAGDDGKGGSKDLTKGKDEGYQGLFSLWGHEVWLYIGGVLGFGRKAGVYLTTGPMIGSNPDWAIGGGIHLFRGFGLGIVVPIRQALSSYSRHQDKLGMIMDQTGNGLTDIVNAASVAVGNSVDTIASLTNYLS